MKVPTLVLPVGASPGGKAAGAVIPRAVDVKMNTAASMGTVTRLSFIASPPYPEFSRYHDPGLLRCEGFPNFTISALGHFSPFATLGRNGRYRELAEEMRSSADKATSDDARHDYLRMAVEWLDMAKRLKARYGKISVKVPAPELSALLQRGR